MYRSFLRPLFPLLIFTFAFFLSTQLGKHFFFPFSYLSGIRIDYLAPTFYFTDILSFFLLNFFVMLYVKKQRVIGVPSKKFLALIVFVTIFIVINYYSSFSKYLWLYRFVRVLQTCFLFYFFYNIGNKKKFYPFVLWGLFLGAVFELILTILQLSFRHSLQGIWYFFGERQFMISTPGIAKAQIMGAEFLRPYGTFSHPNSLAGFYLLIYTFVLTQKKITNMYFKTTFLFLSSALVLVSFSRTAMVVYVLVNLIYFFGKKVDCRPCTLSKVILSFFLLFFVLSIKGDQFSFQKRLTFLNNSIKIITSHPFTGVGMGGYLIAQNAFPQRYSIFFEQPVHNIFFLVVAELGIPLACILLGFIYERIKFFLTTPPFLLPLLCVLITGSIDHYWITLQQNTLLLAIIFGILYAQYEKKTF